MTVADLILKLQEHDPQDAVMVWANRYRVELIVLGETYPCGKVLMDNTIRELND